MDNLTKISPPLSPCSSITGTSITTTSDFADIDYASTSKSTPKSSTLEFNSADIRNSLDRKTSVFREVVNLNEEPGQVNRSQNDTSISLSETNSLDTATEFYKNGPPISSNGALAPPPYRNPPSPKTSSPSLHQQLAYNNLFDNHQRTDSQSSGTTNSSKVIDFGSNKSQHFVKGLSPPLLVTSNNRQASPNIHINALSNLQAVVNTATSEKDLLNDNHFQSAQYRELLQLIHYQREKITNQQVDISKVR